MWVGLDEEEMPSFALVKDICVMETNLSGIWFVTEVLHTAAFSKHFNASEVNNTRKLYIHCHSISSQSGTKKMKSILFAQSTRFQVSKLQMAIWMSSDLVFLLLTTLENMQISTYMAYILSLIGKQWQTLKILGEGVNKIEDIQI